MSASLSVEFFMSFDCGKQIFFGWGGEEGRGW